MRELFVMAHRLKVPEPKMHTEAENRKVPTLEMITGALVSTYLSQELPSTAVCKTIGNIFSKLSEAHKAYAEAADGLAQMSTKVSPEHYTLLLTAATAPAIQLVLPPGVTSPATAPQPPPHQATTLLGKTAIIDATKQKALPNPSAPCLSECNKNTAIRILAIAIYSKLERKYFDIFTTFSLQKMDNTSPEAEDTLESESSSDSLLPEGLPTQR